MVEKSNRVYRISALKSEIPRSAGSFGMGQPIAAAADVVREVNPSFWMDPVTVPLQYLEVVDIEFFIASISLSTRISLGVLTG